jgi:hypothetical protein
MSHEENNPSPRLDIAGSALDILDIGPGLARPYKGGNKNVRKIHVSLLFPET